MSTIAQIGSSLQKMFGECAEKANELHPVVQRRRKFSAVSLAKTFILAYLQNPRANAGEITAMASSCDVFVSKQAVEKRFTDRAVRFFETLFRESTKLIVQSDQTLAPILEQFTEVNIGDSSTITLPDSQQARFQGRGGRSGSGKSAMKLQTELDLKTGKLVCVEVEEGRDADAATSRQTIQRAPGTLRITDLGYFSTAVFTALCAAGCWFLSRIQRTTTVWVGGQNVGNVIQFLMSKKIACIDCWIEIGTKNRTPCRLIAWKVPVAVAAERRRKLRKANKKRGRAAPTKEALAACDWMFLVTNLPEEKLSFKEAIVLYRARWQIELLFKRWKSIGLVALLDGKNDSVKMVRVWARLWARLCAALIGHWLTVLCGWRSDQSISFFQVTKHIPPIVEQIADGLVMSGTASTTALERILQRFYRKTSTSAKRNKRKKTGTIEMLRNTETLDYVLS